MAIIIVLFARAQKCMFLFEVVSGVISWPAPPIARKELVAEYFMTILFEREMSLLRECLKNCSTDWGHLNGRFAGGKHFKVFSGRRGLIGSQPAYGWRMLKPRWLNFPSAFAKLTSLEGKPSFTKDFPRDDFFEQLLSLCDSLRASGSQ